LEENRINIPRFNRSFFDPSLRITAIGSGSIGGKAHGLVFIHDAIASKFDQKCFPELTVEIPRMTVISTECFDQFMEINSLCDIALSDTPDDRIAHAFQRASMTPELVGDLRALISNVHAPLAVRSSSLLEDALFEPFAGIYATKMIPNNQPSIDLRFQKLTEAIKFVWASTFFKEARDYIAATNHNVMEEKMAVIIQEVVGARHDVRFYPEISGVARSFNYYPTGHARAEEGVVHLALGLGKTIVDGGLDWFFSPAFPRAKPPVGSARDLLKMSQSRFWAVNMGKPPEYDPIHETEYLSDCSLKDAEYDGSLDLIASTYDAESDRLVPGTDLAGPRVLTFAPLLDYEQLPLNSALKSLISLGVETLGADIEIEFAINIIKNSTLSAKFGFLQIRPMVVSQAQIELQDDLFKSPRLLAASTNVLGNGDIEGIRDVVFVEPSLFEKQNTPRIALEIEKINEELVRNRTPYVLIGFGRWGSSDPWLGIPVNWSQIAGAKVIVECTLPDMYVELSQGSHFFHNLISFQVSYFSVSHTGEFSIDWEWLAKQQMMTSLQYVRHVRLSDPLTIKVDGRKGKGVILK
jgi:hypothetical protein